MRTLGRYAVLLAGYMRVNLRSSLEYRTNFVFETLLSILEVAMYLFYWQLFFSISGGIPGTTYQQLAALVVFNHLVYAVADTLIGNNVWDATEMIVKGQLDIYLVQPKSAVFQLFFSGAQPLRAVQIVVGVAVWFFIMPFTLHNSLFLVLGSFLGAVIFSSWVIMIHTLAFRLGNSVVVYKLLSVILHFGKKPATIFSTVVRFMLYTIIPAAYIGTVQSDQLFNPQPLTVAGVLTLAVVAPFIAVVVFRRGLRRYESGNLIGVRM